MAEELVKSASNYLINGNWLNGKKVDVIEEPQGSSMSVGQPQPKRTEVFVGSHGQPSALNEPNAETNETTTKKRNGNKSKKTVIFLSLVGVVIVSLVIYLGGFLGNKGIRFKSFQENVNGVPFDMVAVEGGTFLMGSNDGEDDEKPVHSVTVSDFYIGKTEVTVAQFETFVNSTGYLTDADTDGGSFLWNGEEAVKVDGVNWLCDAEGNRRPRSDYNHPAIHVSWNDAIAYCEWLRKQTGRLYRLPTEAEWEYAAGGGTSNRTKWTGTNYETNFGDFAWFYDNSDSKTHSVATKYPNKLDLYDMSGNVWEWCNDWYDAEYYLSSPVNNPLGAATGSNRVIRGGSWDFSLSACRAANRIYKTPDIRGFSLGFRVALAP